MKLLIALTVIFVLSIAFNIIYSRDKEDVLIDKRTDPTEDHSLNRGDVKEKKKSERPSDGISVYIGQSVDKLQQTYGIPDRIEPSFYGYDWWIYHPQDDKYMQVGVKDGRIVTIALAGKEIKAEPFRIGEKLQSIYQKVDMEPEVEIRYEGGIYRFEILEEDLNYRPLVPLGDIYAQLYLDKFTGKLLFIRFMDKRTLLEMKPYDLTYVGKLVEPEELSEEDRLKAEKGTERQIFDLTNLIRSSHQLSPLAWDDKVAEVALNHSKDMFETETFSHESKGYGTLADRLKANGVYYEKAGENIAYQYSDSIAVVAGWLNSKSHRETMLDEAFTHLGVGVYQKYYTENFIRRTWE